MEIAIVRFLGDSTDADFSEMQVNIVPKSEVPSGAALVGFNKDRIPEYLTGHPRLVEIYSKIIRDGLSNS